MIAALIQGMLFRALEQRTSKNGRPYVTTTARIKDGDESLFVRVVAFSESVQSELLRLADGDAVSVQGQLTASIYTSSDRNAKVGLSIVAAQVLPLRASAKERKPKPPAARPGVDEHCRPFDDDIDFGGAP